MTHLTEWVRVEAENKGFPLLTRLLSLVAKCPTESRTGIVVAAGQTIRRLDTQLRDRRHCLSSRDARSSWFPYMAARVVQKAAITSETPEPT